MVAFAYEKRSLTRGFNYNDFTVKKKYIGILEKWSYRRYGRLREVVPHGGLTVFPEGWGGGSNKTFHGRGITQHIPEFHDQRPLGRRKKTVHF